MAFLSQASHLGSLLLPHDTFQEHAAHRAEWSAQLSSKGSERTCIRSGLATFLHCACTAHSDLVVDPWALEGESSSPLDFPIGGFSPPEGRLARGFKPPAFSRFLFQSAVKSAESF
jgi:hypothetical protein